MCEHIRLILIPFMKRAVLNCVHHSNLTEDTIFWKGLKKNFINFRLAKYSMRFMFVKIMEYTSKLSN